MNEMINFIQNFYEIFKYLIYSLRYFVFAYLIYAFAVGILLVQGGCIAPTLEEEIKCYPPGGSEHLCEDPVLAYVCEKEVADAQCYECELAIQKHCKEERCFEELELLCQPKDDFPPCESCLLTIKQTCYSF